MMRSKEDTRGVKSLEYGLRNTRLSSFGYVKRNDENSESASEMELEVEGRTPVGRP